MSDTVFVNGVTLTDEDWFNDVNRTHYTIFGDPANVTAAMNTLLAPVIDAAGDLIQGSAANTVARLALGAAGTRLHSTGSLAEWQGTWFKVGTFSRVMSIATANLSYVGVGFKPKAMVFFGNVANGAVQSSCKGFDDGTSKFLLSDATTAAGAVQFSYVANAIYLFDDALAANTNSASIVSFDADGFTLSWVKAGSPTSTANFGYLAFR